MNGSEISRQRTIIEVKQRRLHELQLQQAGKGSTTEAHILIEIEDLQADLIRSQIELDKLVSQDSNGVSLSGLSLRYSFTYAAISARICGCFNSVRNIVR